MGKLTGFFFLQKTSECFNGLFFPFLIATSFKRQKNKKEQEITPAKERPWLGEKGSVSPVLLSCFPHLLPSMKRSERVLGGQILTEWVAPPQTSCIYLLDVAIGMISQAEFLHYVPYWPAPVLCLEVLEAAVCLEGRAKRPPWNAVCIAKALCVLRWHVCGWEGATKALFWATFILQ